MFDILLFAPNVPLIPHVYASHCYLEFLADELFSMTTNSFEVNHLSVSVIVLSVIW